MYTHKLYFFDPEQAENAQEVVCQAFGTFADLGNGWGKYDYSVEFETEGRLSQRAIASLGQKTSADAYAVNER